MIGIYKITNLKDKNKIYIGRSLHIKQRWKAHIYELKTHRHINKELQDDWDKYGANSFQFNILAECDSNKAAKYWELKEIDKYRKFGYQLYNTPSTKDDIVWYVADKLNKSDKIIDFEIDYIDDRCIGKKNSLHWNIGVHTRSCLLYTSPSPRD